VRTGHSLLQSFEQIARQPPEPMQSAFAQVVREIGLGASQEEALDRLAARFPSEDMDLIVTSIKVHQQTGGSLSRILAIIQHTIQERVRIEGDIRALTSQQRYSAYVLCALPVLVSLVLFLVGGDYMSAMFTTPSLQIALVVAAIMVVVGFFIMRRIAEIDV
jgi:tight adherence protein B